MSRGRGVKSQHQIPNGHFFTLICCKIVCLKRSKINETEARNGPFKNVLELKIKTDVGM